ncbi:hypothetical protein AR679_gp035 [Yellowstone lake phycodnavirus 1]|jgi:hypothetical protein|uniref:hypothetical protein n=1 Tax=Yellowstone lake phycodnavirus 1 TaxID=1586713 RepID=UPI0006EB2C37|nr:hypothetical protein AR679_gp035 [Yellowstone lake phycodnavirus 1]BAT22061.1 hypothetical protein [Yellowstone lake phycodnavirus 1]
MADRTFARLRADLHAARKPVKVIHRTPVAETAPVVPAAKAPAAPPKGQGGPIWQKFLADAVAQGHPEPERLADTLLRAREKTLELNEKRHKVEITTKKPTPAECAGAVAGVKKVTGGALCKAVTLENRPCKFRAVCGAFCKKHSSGK